MGALLKDDFKTMEPFIENFLILPERMNVLHFYAYQDRADEFDQALLCGEFYVSYHDKAN